MCLIDLAGSHEGLVISVVSETMPHLRKGAMRDFLSIMEARGYFVPSRWKQSPDFTYTFETGSIIEFFSADSSDKVRGPGRDILFINECNNVSFETYRQLALRTTKVIYLDFNSVAEFYVHTDLIDRPDADFAKLTYLDNEALPIEIIREIELLKTNENLWRIYGLGEIGINERQIFTNWDLSLPEPPEAARLERHGLDYGYTNDPSALGHLPLERRLRARRGALRDWS
jgi:phage terminase large subunit